MKYSIFYSYDELTPKKDDNRFLSVAGRLTNLYLTGATQLSMVSRMEVFIHDYIHYKILYSIGQI
jgi:hypothetical protein